MALSSIMKKSALIWSISAIFLLGITVKDHPVGVNYALEGISPQAIQAHMRFLSSDLLQGRLPGTPGYDIAAKYMATQFEKMGLIPLGDDSTYYQDVVLSRFNIDYSSSAISVISRKEAKVLTIDENYFVYARHDVEESGEENEMIFSGFGIEYPSEGYSPVKSADINRKMVIALLGNPEFDPRDQSTGIFEKMEMAESLGAKGLVLITTPEILKRYSWSRLKYMTSRGFDIKSKNSPEHFFTAIIHHDVAADLTGFSIDSLQVLANSKSFQSFKLPTSISYHIHVSRDDQITQSPNVVAMIPGADSVLKKEYVVYTAHLDHIGVGGAVQGDSIYNGAYDNASGCAILLEIANAFKQLQTPPSRSIIFAILTSEEIGLFGSRYFVKYPVVPLENIVANLNIDMVLMEGPLQKAVALGKEYVDFEDIIEESAHELNIELMQDPMPQERLFMRSDHYSFVQQGIPALFVINDLTDSLNQAWFNNYYHKPQDEIRDNMHFEAGASHAKLNFMIGYRISKKKERPQWKPDSEYHPKNRIN